MMNEIEYLRRLYITFIMGVKSKHAGRFYRYLPTQLGREPVILSRYYLTPSPSEGRGAPARNASASVADGELPDLTEIATPRCASLAMTR